MTAFTAPDPLRAMPVGTHYSITTGVGGKFGGMTTALLYRSRCFVEQTGTDVTIVTYDHRDYDSVRNDLRTRGHLVDGMSILNLFEDIRAWDDTKLRKAKRTFARALKIDPNAADVPRHSETPGTFWEESSVDVYDPAKDETKSVVTQVNHFRADGSICIAESRSLYLRDDANSLVRTYVLFDLHGKPLGVWGSEGDLLRFWLDTLPRDPIAWFIIDSKESAKILTHYQRDDVVTLHLVHSTHLARGKRDTLNFRKYVMERLDSFDAAVFLTESQLADVDSLLGAGKGNHYSVGNACMVPETMPTGRRDKSRGVMLGRLDGGKRVDHAIEAIAENVDVVNPHNRPHLDAYGEGDLEPVLSAKISTLEADPQIALRLFLSRFVGRRLAAAIDHRVNRKPIATLHGYKANAREEYNSAGFSMLTSKNEGFGLVVVESMGRGCIPICYDMSYGPGDIITHGVDGLLVPMNDKKALAKAVRKIVTMDRADLEKMRAAAFQRAQDFNGESITARWIDVMDSALSAKQVEVSFVQREAV